MAPKGYLNIVLHAHLPYVRHPESEEYIEERWLFEAISETYIPLLIYFDSLENDDETKKGMDKHTYASYKDSFKAAADAMHKLAEEAQPIRTGIVGVGNMGSSHIRNFLDGDMSEMRVTAVADINPDRLEWAKKNVPWAKRYSTAKELFERLGAEVLMISSEPDGTNINKDCGSTHIDSLMEYVTENGCDCGLAFDGDADRCLAVDENGELIDGDKIIAICAKAYKEQGKLKNDAAVVTVMSNLGFTHFAKENGIKTITAGVGDRYVLEKMLDGGYNIGGEQSGHIIFLDHATTGDGQLSGAKLLEILVKSGKKMSELANIMYKFPQVMINVPISPKDKEVWKNDTEITGLIEKHEAELGESGRILVRESGTEPLIRVMIEGKDFKNINSMAIEIADKIKERSGR